MRHLVGFFVLQSVGCDNMLESGAKYDRCAVCEGDSSTCDFVRGEYTKNWFRWGKIFDIYIV